jgi:hypothetical protein
MLKALDAGRYLIVAGCLYEAYSVPYRTRTPTITTIIHRSQRHRAGKVLCVVWLALWAHHFVKTEHSS